MINFYEEALKRKDELVEDLMTLVKIPSVDDPSTAKENQPFGQANREALDAMLAIGKRDGYVVEDVTSTIEFEYSESTNISTSVGITFSDGTSGIGSL